MKLPHQVFLLGALLAFLVFGCSGSETVPRGDSPLAAAESAGQEKNEEGIQQYEKRRWAEAESLFRDSIKGDPELAEAHYNLGLTLDKLGLHEDAAEAFQVAANLGSSKWALEESVILKEHLGM